MSIADLNMEEARKRMKALYGENKKIADGNYDKSLAVKCKNGTFVGKKSGDVIAYKGIPFVGKQPVGGLRWKAPVDCVPDDDVYEAYYIGKAPRQGESAVQVGSFYPQSEECLYLNIWAAADSGKKNRSWYGSTAALLRSVRRLNRGRRAQISSRRIRMLSSFPSSIAWVSLDSSICPIFRTEETIRMPRIWGSGSGNGIKVGT